MRRRREPPRVRVLDVRKRPLQAGLAPETLAAIRAAKDNTPVTDDTVNDADSGDTPAAAQTSADTNGDQQH